MIKACISRMQVRMIRIYNRVREARDLLQPDTRRHGSLITCNAATPSHTDLEPMGAMDPSVTRCHTGISGLIGIHRSQSLGTWPGRRWIHGDPVAGVAGVTG